jgi:hypothetical protein
MQSDLQHPVWKEFHVITHAWIFFSPPSVRLQICWPSSLSEKLLSAVPLFGSHFLHTTISNNSRCAVLLPSEPASKREKI